MPTHQDSPHLVAKSCCFLADARIEVRTCAHWQIDGSSCAAPRHQQTAYATLLGLSLSELCEELEHCRSYVASMGQAAAASSMMQPSQSKREGLWAMEAAVVICASLRKGACVDTARVPVPWRSLSSSARLCLSGTVTCVESDVDSTTSCQAASDYLVALSGAPKI